MILSMTPLEETPAYKSIFAKGEAMGEAMGFAKSEALLAQLMERYERCYRDGLLSEQAYLTLVSPLREDIEDIHRLLKKD